ncbi:hypothetical protein BHM03_00009443, partial [Ensete ventricosum]
NERREGRRKRKRKRKKEDEEKIWKRSRGGGRGGDVWEQVTDAQAVGVGVVIGEDNCARRKRSCVANRRGLPTWVRSHRCFPLFLVSLDEEKTVAKKSPPREVLICDTVSRFSDCRRLR